MQRDDRRFSESWGLWIVLLGMTGLASSWIEKPSSSHRRGDVPVLRAGGVAFDDEEHRIERPRIVFPAVEEQ